MNTEEVQRRLWEQSKTHKENREASLPLFPTSMYDLRIRNLSDLTHHPNWLNPPVIPTDTCLHRHLFFVLYNGSRISCLSLCFYQPFFCFCNRSLQNRR